MKKVMAFVFGFGLLAAANGAARADGAIICTSSSTGACAGKQYCCYSGSESDGDKMCKKLGCVRGGTSSCPTAANVHSCGTRVNIQGAKPMQSLPSDVASFLD
jgi:hypothetical protein